MSSAATPGLLRSANHRYIELVRGLGPAGVMRVGGIVANYSQYIPNGPVHDDRQNTVINYAILEEFGAFLNQIGWSTIWSVNLARMSAVVLRAH